MRPRSKKTKKVLRMHAKRRAVQRFGLHLNQNDFEQIVQQIQKGEARLIDRQSSNITRWYVDYKGHTMAVAYDRQRKMIRTVLTKEQVEGVA